MSAAPALPRRARSARLAPRPRAAAAAAAALGALLALAAGCDDPAPATTRVASYRDLLIERAGRGGPKLLQRFCADETHLAIELAAGESQEWVLDVPPGSSLEMSGCRMRGEGVGPGARESVRAVARLAGGSRPRRLDLPIGGGWASHRFELPAEWTGKVRLRLVADLEPGSRVYVRDFALRTVAPLPPRPPQPAVLLISLDAFREDAIGALGGRTATPALDRLLAESERFTPHWSAEISTKPSHASMLTGLPSEVHGCDREATPLAEEVSTLAERVAAAGAETGAFMSVAPFFHERYQLAQGFGTYRLAAWTSRQELRAATSWIAAHRDDPFFLFVHLYGAHSDYSKLPYEAKGVTRATVRERFGVPGYGCRNRNCASGLLLTINQGVTPAIAGEAEILRYLYDRGVESLDHDLGLLFDDLRAAGVWDDLLIVLTGDHGEQFGEHGYFLHTTPHEETLRVPLLVKWPRGARAGTTTERFSTALDVTPTILARFGLEAPDLAGQDLARPPAGGAPVMVSRHAVRVGDLKLVLATPEAPEALYDLARDPGETTNLLPAAAADAERLRQAHARANDRALRLAARTFSTEAKPYTDEELAQLRSLGYVQ